MHPFYGVEIDLEREQEKINQLLAKYRNEPVSDVLKKKIYDELSAAKTAGVLHVPFKVVMRRDPSGHHRDFIEVTLDTKV